jgi:hypothetical protein
MLVGGHLPCLWTSGASVLNFRAPVYALNQPVLTRARVFSVFCRFRSLDLPRVNRKKQGDWVVDWGCRLRHDDRGQPPPSPPRHCPRGVRPLQGRCHGVGGHHDQLTTSEVALLLKVCAPNCWQVDTSRNRLQIGIDRMRRGASFLFLNRRRRARS